MATATLPTAYSRIRSQPMIHATSLAERRVGVRVRAAGLRDHRGELRVAERRQRARGAEQQERKDERRPGAVANDLTARSDLTGRSGPDRAEDAGADDGADRQHDQIASAEHALQANGAVESAGARRSACGRTAATCGGIKPRGHEPRRHGEHGDQKKGPADRSSRIGRRFRSTRRPARHWARTRHRRASRPRRSA